MYIVQLLISAEKKPPKYPKFRNQCVANKIYLTNSCLQMWRCCDQKVKIYMDN